LKKEVNDKRKYQTMIKEVTARTCVSWHTILSLSVQQSYKSVRWLFLILVESMNNTRKECWWL